MFRSGSSGIPLALAALLAVASPAHGAPCEGDCDGDNQVRVEELVRGVGLALGEDDGGACDGFGTRPVRIETLVRAATNLLGYCGPIGGGPATLLAFAGTVRNAPLVIGSTADVGVSADGAHVYVASSSSLATFARNGADGRLAYVADTLSDGFGARALALSPDGRHLYAVLRWHEFTPAPIGAFARDAGSGRLTRVDFLPGGRDTPLGGFEFEYIAVSPDGQSVYAATQQPGGGSPALVAWRRDPLSGRLTFVESHSWDDLALESIDALAVGAGHVYVAGGANSRRYSAGIVELRRTAAGALHVTARVLQEVHGLVQVNALAVDPSGRLYVSGGEEDAAVLLRLAHDDGAAWAVEERLVVESGFAAKDLALSADGRRLYVAEGPSALALVAIGSDGRLTPVTRILGDDLGTRDVLALSPDGTHAYTTSLVTAGISAVALAGDGLTLIDSWTRTLGGIEGLIGVTRLAVSPDGAHLYAGAANKLATYARDADLLREVEVLRNNQGGITHLDGLDFGALGISPDGAHVYATAFFSEAVLSFRRDPASGRLTMLDAFTDIAQDGVFAEEYPRGLVLSPDGANVYVSGRSDVDSRNFVAAFDRQPQSGAITWTGGARNGGGTLAASPDGSAIYAADGALSVYARGAGGRLSVLGLAPDAAGTVVAVSPDSAHVYLASEERSTVGVFKRGTDGRLTHLGDDETSLHGVAGLAVSPDGGAVYAVSRAEGELAVLTRVAGSGRLHWNETHADGRGADGLAGAAAVVTSPDGQWVYVAGADEHAIGMFRLTGQGLLANGQSCSEAVECASGVCDFSLDAFGEGGAAGPIFPLVCCERLCLLEEACDDQGVCRFRF